MVGHSPDLVAEDAVTVGVKATMVTVNIIKIAKNLSPRGQKTGNKAICWQ